LSHDAQHQAEPFASSYCHLLPLLWPLRIGINASLDLGKAFLMTVDHAGDCDYAPNDNCANRNQQTAQTCNRIDQTHRWTSGAKAHDPFLVFSGAAEAAPFQTSARQISFRPKILVELTGIEPVASWLQTRRSPS
jgi:hypothetical protein